MCRDEISRRTYDGGSSYIPPRPPDQVTPSSKSGPLRLSQLRDPRTMKSTTAARRNGLSTPRSIGLESQLRCVPPECFRMMGISSAPNRASGVNRPRRLTALIASTAEQRFPSLYLRDGGADRAPVPEWFPR